MSARARALLATALVTLGGIAFASVFVTHVLEMAGVLDGNRELFREARAVVGMVLLGIGAFTNPFHGFEPDPASPTERRRVAAGVTLVVLVAAGALVALDRREHARREAGDPLALAGLGHPRLGRTTNLLDEPIVAGPRLVAEDFASLGSAAVAAQRLGASAAVLEVSRPGADPSFTVVSLRSGSGVEVPLDLAADPEWRSRVHAPPRSLVAITDGQVTLFPVRDADGRASRSSSWQVRDLVAHPEHVDPKAYAEWMKDEARRRGWDRPAPLDVPSPPEQPSSSPDFPSFPGD